MLQWEMIGFQCYLFHIFYATQRGIYYFQFYFFLSVLHACTHGCPCPWVYVWICAGKKLVLSILFCHSLPCILRQDLILTRELISWLDWLSNQGYSSHLHSSRITGTSHHVWNFCCHCCFEHGYWGFRLRSSHVCSKNFTPWVSPPPRLPYDSWIHICTV